VLTDTLGWESIFYLNVPIGVVVLAIAALKLRESRDPDATRIDWAGVATFSSALVLLVLALVRGNDEGWSSPLIVSLLAGSAVLMLAFVAVERIVREPMLPLALFRIPTFTGVQIAAFAVSSSLFASFLYLSLYLQNYLGYSPLQTGLRYLPITLAAFVCGPISGALISRVPARVLMSSGLALAGVGMLLMSGVEAGSEWTAMLGGFIVAGAGVGLLNPVIADVAVGVVPKERSGMAAGINNTFRQVGIAVGIAVMGSIFVGRGADKVAELTAGTPTASGDRPHQLVEAASSGSLHQALAAIPPQSRQAVADAAGQGFLAGFNDVLMVGGVVSLVGAALVLWLVRSRDLVEAGVPEEEVERPLELAA
jgi:predicted MFS family arabinose efflux permease